MLCRVSKNKQTKEMQMSQIPVKRQQSYAGQRISSVSDTISSMRAQS
jgi:hypothetical protein